MSRPSCVSLIAAFAATMLAIPSMCHAGPWLPAPGEYYSELQGTHIGNGGHFFDYAGKNLDFGFLEEMRDIHSLNELGWKSWVSFRLGARMRSVTLRFDPVPPSGIRTATASQTGLSDLLLGTRFRLYDHGATALAIEANWLMPLGYERDVVPSLGDGLSHFSAHAEAGMPLPAFQGFAQAGLGYVTRIDIRMNPMSATHAVGSPAMLYEADLAAWLGNSVLVAGRYHGYSSNAQDAGDLDRSLHSVGPEIRYRIDDRMEVYTGATVDIAGRNTFQQNVYYLGLAMKQTRLNRLQGFLGAGRRP
jgi:hypothetical protein